MTPTRWHRLFDASLKSGAAACLAFVVYGVAYLFVLEAKVYRQTGTDPTTRQNIFAIEPWYRIRWQPLETVFAPAHCLDRALRRDYWTTIAHSSGRKSKNPVPASARPR